jgi:hypothetical protein
MGHTDMSSLTTPLAVTCEERVEKQGISLKKQGIEGIQDTEFKEHENTINGVGRIPDRKLNMDDDSECEPKQQDNMGACKNVEEQCTSKKIS